jgi:hypothetical protein
MAVVQYESKDNAGHRFWTARYGRYAIRIDANRPGIYRWMITLEGRTVRNGVAPDRDGAAAAVSDALDELPRWKVEDVMLADRDLAHEPLNRR